MLEVCRGQVLVVVGEGEVDLRRGQLAPVLVNIAAPVSARVLHLVLPLLVDEHFLVCLQVH